MNKEQESVKKVCRAVAESANGYVPVEEFTGLVEKSYFSRNEYTPVGEFEAILLMNICRNLLYGFIYVSLCSYNCKPSEVFRMRIKQMIQDHLEF